MAESFEVIVTGSAESDLEAIVEYVSDTTSYEHALKVRDQIVAAIEGLETMPERHAPLKETVEYVVDYYRRVLAGNYKIIFTIEQAVDIVFVIRIIHIRRGGEYVRNALT